jgi:8-oxo-dGTP pyrophosphatase MutT (NUDIX family)
MSNDRWTTCRQGHRHWGVAGAAGLLLRHTDVDGTVRFLLQHRAPWVHHGDTWSIPGGAILEGETPVQAAVRETLEETGSLPEVFAVDRVDVDDHGNWAYRTVVADVPQRTLSGDTAEQQGTAWFTAEEMLGLSLHPGFAGYLSRFVRESAGKTRESPSCQVGG